MLRVTSWSWPGAALCACLATGCATEAADTSTGSSTGGGGDGTTTSTTTAGSGAGGDGGDGGGGGGGGGATTATSSSTGGGPNCGDGVIEAPEQCEGSDFGGRTCEDFGLGAGALICNPYCAIVVSGCTPKEACNDGNDNDGDALTDCADPECATAVACTDSCAGAKVASVPSFQFGDIAGEPSLLEPSCTAASGREQVFSVTAVVDGNLSVTLSSFGFDGVVHIRATCDDPLSEIACVNAKGSDQSESASVPALAGQKFYVIVDSTSATATGSYDVSVDQPLPESSCDDGYDDDFDGYLDCDDPTSCQGSSECVPGSGPLGVPCFSNTDCASGNGDPICLGFQQGFSNGYCSEFCSGPGDCPGDGVCLDLGVSVHGVCFDSCQTAADCQNGLACVSLPGGPKICDKAPETACADWADNDQDGFEDCDDPTSCQGTASCTPGAGAVGVACSNHFDCQSGNGDPYCIDSFWNGWPGGYCAEFCDLAADDCAAGSTCTDWLFFQSGHGVCMKNCNVQGDCRPGYSCLSLGFASDVCVY